MERRPTGKPVELIGEHCSLQGCNQLDFLPYVCEQCGQTFCGQHRLPESHHCKKTVTQTTKTIPSSKQLLTCSKPNCRHISVMQCGHCCQSFCASHRDPSVHGCKRKEPEKEKPKSNILEKLAKKFQSHTTNSKTATTVMDMKQRSKAIGDPQVPVEDRVYLHVSVDRHLKESPPLLLYYPKNINFGQVLDKICEMTGITNRNHENNARKLVLLDSNSRKPIASSQLLSEYKKPGMLSVILTQLDMHHSNT